VKYFFVVAAVLAVVNSHAQIEPLTLEPDGGNKKASVSEQIGIVKVSINYNRPGVKGREGKIWNTSVAHYGFTDALIYMEAALPLAPDEGSKNSVQSMISKLKEGKNIN